MTNALTNLKRLTIVLPGWTVVDESAIPVVKQRCNFSPRAKFHFKAPFNIFNADKL